MRRKTHEGEGEFIPVEALAEVTQEKRPDGMWELRDANGFVKPAGVKLFGGRPALHLLNRRGNPIPVVWAVDTSADSAVAAEKHGLAIRRQLIAKSKLPSSIPYVHDAPLYVGWSGGDVRVEPLVKKARKRSTPKVADARAAALKSVDSAVGHLLKGKLKVTGSTAKGWTLILPFRDSRLGTQPMRVVAFDEVPDKVAEMVAKLKQWGIL